MGLAPTQPDQDVIDGLLIDAAWDHAKELELTNKRLRLMVKQSKQAFEKEFAKRTRLEKGIRGVIKDVFYADKADIRRDLEALLFDE